MRQHETWDTGSLDALRGYAALSRDEASGKDVDWQHLHQNNGQEGQGRQDSEFSGSSRNSTGHQDEDLKLANRDDVNEIDEEIIDKPLVR